MITKESIESLLLCGVYEITCLGNGKRYIGSTRKSFQRRMTSHVILLRKNKHHNRNMQNSWNKYGERSFSFRIYRACSAREAYDFEQAAITETQPAFNSDRTVRHVGVIVRHPNMSIWMHVAINKIVLILAKTGLLSSLLKFVGGGRPMCEFFGVKGVGKISDDVKRKMSASNLGKSRGKGIPKSESHRAAQGAARLAYVDRMRLAGEWPPLFYKKAS